MIREHLGGVIERMEKYRAQALMRAESAKAQAQAYAEVIEELRRLDGIALADEVLRGRVRAFDEEQGPPPSTYDKPQRCTTEPKDEPPPTEDGEPTEPTEPTEQEIDRQEEEERRSHHSPDVGKMGGATPPRKGSPPCPLCQCGTIVYRKTGRLICLNEECPNSRTVQEATRPKPTGKAQPVEPEEDTGSGEILNIGNGKQDLPEGTNLAACVAAIRYREPHWLTTSGILEVIRQRLRSQLPETMAQIIGQEMNKARKSKAYSVPGLQARMVDARRWEYRIVGKKPEGD